LQKLNAGSVNFFNKDRMGDLKYLAKNAGRLLIEGEFNAMSELYKLMPNFVSKPHSWGKYRVENPETFFFLSHIIDPSDRFPEPNQLCSKLAQLHRSSASPTGKFGLYVTTCQGRTPQVFLGKVVGPIFSPSYCGMLQSSTSKRMGTGKGLTGLKGYSQTSFQD
jgi:hypothetical protein